MKVKHLHLMVPDVRAAVGLDVQPPKRSHACSFYVKAPGDFLVEVGA